MLVMTVIEIPTASTALVPVTFDLYRDIHKAIRTELFAVTTEAASLDPGDEYARAALADHVRDVFALLVAHAEHEDGAIQPALEQHLPDLAEQVEVDHITLEGRMEVLQELADTAASGGSGSTGFDVHRFHLAFASFTSAYLMHQDTEERVIMPALETAVGVDEVVRIHQVILASIPPGEMAKSLALMLPAMNIDGRADLLGGMRAGAPAEVFQGVWSLAGSVLDVSDFQALATRLGIA